MAKFTNTHATGMRGIVLKSGETLWVDAGKTADVDGEVAKHGLHEDFKQAGADVESGTPALQGKTKADLLAIAKDENVTVEESATNAQIIEAIEAKREADKG